MTDMIKAEIRLLGRMHIGCFSGRRRQNLSDRNTRVQNHFAHNRTSLHSLVPSQLFDSVRRRGKLEIRRAEFEFERET